MFRTAVSTLNPMTHQLRLYQELHPGIARCNLRRKLVRSKVQLVSDIQISKTVSRNDSDQQEIMTFDTFAEGAN